MSIEEIRKSIVKVENKLLKRRKTRKIFFIIFLCSIGLASILNTFLPFIIGKNIVLSVLNYVNLPIIVSSSIALSILSSIISTKKEKLELLKQKERDEQLLEDALKHEPDLPMPATESDNKQEDEKIVLQEPEIKTEQSPLEDGEQNAQVNTEKEELLRHYKKVFVGHCKTEQNFPGALYSLASLLLFIFEWYYLFFYEGAFSRLWQTAIYMIVMFMFYSNFVAFFIWQSCKYVNEKKKLKELKEKIYGDYKEYFYQMLDEKNARYAKWLSQNKAQILLLVIKIAIWFWLRQFIGNIIFVLILIDIVITVAYLVGMKIKLNKDCKASLKIQSELLEDKAKNIEDVLCEQPKADAEKQKTNAEKQIFKM